MRVITSENAYHTSLQPYKQTEVEVIEQTLILCKVAVKGYSAPVRFAVSFRGEGGPGRRQSDLKVYLSMNNRDPDESHCEKAVVNVNTSILML